MLKKTSSEVVCYSWHMNKPAKLILFVATALAVLSALIFYRPIYGYVTAPKFDTVGYIETRYQRETMCLTLVACRYSPVHNYSATGLQKGFIADIASNFEKQNIKLRNNFDGHGYDVQCYGRIGDRYYFERPGAEGYPEIIRVTFYPEEVVEHVNTNELGCNRSEVKYRVEIDGYGNVWLPGL